MELTVIGFNAWGTRKAYEDKEGNTYVDCKHCNEVKRIEDFPKSSNKNTFMQVTTKCKPCSKAYNDSRNHKYYDSEKAKAEYAKKKEIKEEELKRTTYTLINVNGVEVKAYYHSKSRYGRMAYSYEGELYLDCRKCKDVLHSSMFSKGSKGSFHGCHNECKECSKARSKAHREENPEVYKEHSKINNKKHSEQRKQVRMQLIISSHTNTVIEGETISLVPIDCSVQGRVLWQGILNNEVTNFLKCKQCEEIIPVNNFAKMYRTTNTYIDGTEFRSNTCRSCDVRHINREARKRDLPDTLTKDQHSEILRKYSWSCALTGVTIDIQFDHVIPLAIGHGGTTYENMLPLSASLNASKCASNVFEWAEHNHNRLGFTMERFNEVMTEVASRSNLTLDQYKDHVNWCYENKRELATV